MTAPLRAVLFDWDDTLSFVTPHRFEIIQALLAGHGLQVSRAQISRAWAAASRDLNPLGTRARVCELLGVGERPEVASALIEALDWRDGSKQRRIFADVPSALRYLRGLGLRVGVLSDNTEAGTDVGQQGLSHLLDLVITPLHAGAMKPSPGIFQSALSTLGINADESLYVGDAYEVDIVGARAAGLDCLLIDRFDLGFGNDTALDCPCVTDLDGVLRYIAERRYG